MRNARNLSDEQIAELSAPVDKPTAQWESFQETGALRPVSQRAPRRRGGPFEALHAVGERLEARGSLEFSEVDLSSFDDISAERPSLFGLDLPRPSKIWENIPGSAGRLYDEVMGTISLQPLFNREAGFTEQQRDIGRMVGDVATLIWEDIPLVQAHRMQKERELARYYGREVSGDVLRTPEVESLSQVVETVEQISPVGPAEGGGLEWRGTGAIAELIEQEPTEFLLELGTMGLGAGFTGARRMLRATRPFESDFFDDIDVFTGRDIGRQRQAATVELDIARQGRRDTSFARSGMGAVVADPTGRQHIATAAHVVVGQHGRPLDVAGIRATTGTGEIGTVRGISQIDLERDIALLEVSGLTETLDIPDLPGGRHTLLGREGTRAEARIVGESGASLETTTAVGVAGESGAPLIGEGADLVGGYTGLLEQDGRVVRGMYFPVSAVSDLLGEVDGRRIPLGRELSQRAVREGLGHRIGRGDVGVHIEGETPFVQRTPVTPGEVAAPVMLFPQVQFAGDSVQHHSFDPDDDWRGTLHAMMGEMAEQRQSRIQQRESRVRYADAPQPDVLLRQDRREALQQGQLPDFSPDAPLPELFSAVSADPELFFYVGQRGAELSEQAILDRPQTRRYRDWLEEGVPWEDEFPLEESSVLVDPGRMLSPEGRPSQHAHVMRQGVVGYRDVTELGQHLRGLGGVSREAYTLQVGRGVAADVQGQLGLGSSPSDMFFQAESLLEIELPHVAELRDVYQEIRTSGGRVRQPGLDEPLEVTIAQQMTAGGVWEHQKVPYVPKRRAPSEDYKNIRSMPMAELLEWDAWGASSGVGFSDIPDPDTVDWLAKSPDFRMSTLGWVKKAREEIWRRRLSHPDPKVRAEYQRWRRMDQASEAAKNVHKELSFEHDVEAQEYARDTTEDTRRLDGQQYAREAFEAPDLGATGADEVGIYAPQWRDKQADFKSDDDLAS